MPSEHHRHHRSVQGAKFAIAVALPGSDGICGVAIVGRPVARHLDDGWTLEVTRLCTNGAPNACSKLRRRLEGGQGTGLHAADHLLLPEEGGASLRAAGWRLVGTRGGGAWSRPSRRRADTPEHLRGPKCLWQAPGGADKGKRPDAD